MRANKVTISEAINRYYIQVMLPFFVIMFSGLGFGAFLVKENVLLGTVLILSGIIGGSVAGSILHAHWVVWAFHSVEKPNLLYNAALRRNFLKPKGHFYNKLTITLTVNKELYNQAWDKMFEKGDLKDAVSELPISGIVEVRYSAKSFILSLVILGALVVFYAYLVFSSYDTLPPKGKLMVYAGPVAILFLGYETYKLAKNNGKTAFVFNPNYLEFFGRQLDWDSILTFQVYLEGRHDYKVTLAARTSEIVDGKGTMYSATKELNGLDATPDRIEELYAIYKELYSSKS